MLESVSAGGSGAGSATGFTCSETRGDRLRAGGGTSGSSLGSTDSELMLERVSSGMDASIGVTCSTEMVERVSTGEGFSSSAIGSISTMDCTGEKTRVCGGGKMGVFLNGGAGNRASLLSMSGSNCAPVSLYVDDMVESGLETSESVIVPTVSLFEASAYTPAPPEAERWWAVTTLTGEGGAESEPAAV